MKHALLILSILISFTTFAGDSVPHTRVITLPVNFTTSCPPDPFPFYPWDASCHDSRGSTEEYALFNLEDSMLYKLTNGALIVNTPGCPPLPNPWYPYDASCGSTIGSNEIYAQWYVLHLIDSILSASGGTGNLSGTLTPPRIPRASAPHTLVDGDLSDSSGVVVFENSSYALGSDKIGRLNLNGGVAQFVSGGANATFSASSKGYVFHSTFPGTNNITQSAGGGIVLEDTQKVSIVTPNLLFTSSPTTGYVWTCQSGSGLGAWAAPSASLNGTVNYMARFNTTTSANSSTIFEDTGNDSVVITNGVNPAQKVAFNFDEPGACTSIFGMPLVIGLQSYPGHGYGALDINGVSGGNNDIVQFASGVLRLDVYTESGNRERIDMYNTDGATVGNRIQTGGSSYLNGGNLVIGGTTPDPSTILDLQSTTQALGLPSMTTTQVLAIPSPRAGVMVWNNTTTRINYFDGTQWNYIVGVPGN